MDKLFDSKFKKSFIDAVSTTEAAGVFSNFVDEVSSSSYKTDKILLSSFFTDDKPSWLTLLLDKVGKETTIDTIRSDLESLKDYILGVDSINIKMPFKPSEEFLSEVHKIFDSAGYKDYLINLEIDESGGLDSGFSIEGKYLSVSLKNYIRNHLLSKDVFKRNI